MAGVVLDTTVLVDHLKDVALAQRWLLDLQEPPFSSELVRAEIIRGLRSAERGRAEVLFAAIQWVAVTEPVSRLAGELGRRYRRSHQGIGTVDLVLAATAQLLRTTVATHNVKHFPMLKGLRPPY